MAQFKGKNSSGNRFSGLTHRQIGVYAIQFLGIFAGTFLILFLLGFVPKELRELRDQATEPARTTEAPVRENIGVPTAQSRTVPTRVIIGKIGVDSTIEHPQSPDIGVLDAALTKGAVYYPGSGTIEDGNIFLFGHSTGFRVVQNQAYKTFNGLEKLVVGDVITLWGDDGRVYTYRVDTVSLVDEDEALVNFDTSDNRLTISTCNTFGAKEERWVVEATLRS